MSKITVLTFGMVRPHAILELTTESGWDVVAGHTFSVRFGFGACFLGVTWRKKTPALHEERCEEALFLECLGTHLVVLAVEERLFCTTKKQSV